MLPIGTEAPNFELWDSVSSSTKTLNQIKGFHGTLVMFICNHCPFVIHVNDELVKMANEYQERGVNFIAISSNDIENYPEDAPDLMKQLAKDVNYPFPYLYDETQEVAKKYAAACTPDIYVFDEDLKAVYHGQIDNSRPGNGKPVTGNDLRDSLNNLIENRAVIENQKPSMGCGIKWRL